MLKIKLIVLLMAVLMPFQSIAEEIIVKIPEGVGYIKITGDNIRVTRATVVDLGDGPTTPTPPPGGARTR